MVLVSAQESEGACYPPWETAPYGVVSLLDMLEFAANEYIEIAHRFGMVLGAVHGQPANQVIDLSKELERLLEGTNRLGLLVTRDSIGEFLLEVVKEHPGSVSMTGTGDDRMVRYNNISLNNERTCHHVEAIYSTLKAELRTTLFKVIPKERAKFCDPKWLTTGPIFEKFPETVDEFQRAGRCFAYGENTACVFHLMRVADFCFRKVAGSLEIPYDARNWHGIANAISKKMEQKYQTKTDDWRQKEPFYAEILTDVQAVSIGHRNPVLHELENKYDERDADYMLTVIKSFAKHVAVNL